MNLVMFPIKTKTKLINLTYQSFVKFICERRKNPAVLCTFVIQAVANKHQIFT